MVSSSHISESASRTPLRRESSPTRQRQPHPSGAMASLGAIISSWFIDASKIQEELMDPEVRNRRLEIARTENQRFISESIIAIRKGNLPGMFSRRRLQKLLEEEIYRNMALALAFDNFASILQKQDDEESVVEEVCFSSWDHFKSFLWLFNHIANGLQASSKPIGSTFIDSRGDIISPVGLASAFSGLFSSQAERGRLTRGGISSSFLLLESAHTHYYILPTRNRGIGSTPKIQGDVTMSGPVTPFTTKSRLWGTSEKPSSASSTGEFRIPKSSPASSPWADSEASRREHNDGQERSSHTPSPSLLPKRIQSRKSPAGCEVGGPDSHQAASLGTPEGISMKMVEDIVLFPPFKSSRSRGFRYYKGRLLQTATEPKNVMGEIPPYISVPALRSNIFGIYGAKSLSDGNPDTAVKAMGGDVEDPTFAAVVNNVGLSSKSAKNSVGWTYLFEEALLNSTESKLWANMQFWEDMFLDTVTQERELLGLDFGPTDLLQHYSDLDAVDRKRLELQEDCLLANTLHNLIAFMVMARVSVEQIRRKARRLLAKSHTGLHYTQKISKLLDCLECLASIFVTFHS
uniref:MAP kinase-activating death domain protein n=2 Tax=Schistocephalus solidus TaxID=70667 RepID=A0A0X3NGE7_SCHSO